jgi:hypothetical protein
MARPQPRGLNGPKGKLVSSLVLRVWRSALPKPDPQRASGCGLLRSRGADLGQPDRQIRCGADDLPVRFHHAIARRRASPANHNWYGVRPCSSKLLQGVHRDDARLCCRLTAFLAHPQRAGRCVRQRALEPCDIPLGGRLRRRGRCSRHAPKAHRQDDP